MNEILLVVLAVVFIVYFFTPFRKNIDAIFGVKASNSQASQTPKAKVCPTNTAPRIPEDSMLRRHFIAHVQAEIEAELPPRPSDSTLKRHFDSLVASELSDRLARLM